MLTPRAAGIAGLLTVTALLLAGCVAAMPLPSPTSSATAGSSPPTTAPQVSSSPAVAPRVPTSCADLVDEETYAATFGDVPLNDPAVVGDRPSGDIAPGDLASWMPKDDVPMTAGSELFCVWADPGADVTSLTVTVSVLAAQARAAAFELLAQRGYTCEQQGDGEQCAISSQIARYGVEESHTYYARDDVVVLVSQANFPTNGLMKAIVSRIWAAA